MWLVNPIRCGFIEFHVYYVCILVLYMMPKAMKQHHQQQKRIKNKRYINLLALDLREANIYIPTITEK